MGDTPPIVEAYRGPFSLNSKGLRVFLLARRAILGQGKNSPEWRGASGSGLNWGLETAPAEGPAGVRG
jgi:hypothetical protein